MTMIKPGTPCFLINLSPSNAQLAGRVVEVVSGPVPFPGEDGDWYVIQSAWLREMFSAGQEVHARRPALLPIVPPELSPSRAARRRQCEPEDAR